MALSEFVLEFGAGEKMVGMPFFGRKIRVKIVNFVDLENKTILFIFQMTIMNLLPFLFGSHSS